MVTARARKNVPVTPVIEIKGRKTTTGVTVEPIRGTVISRQCAMDGLQPAFAGIAVQHDVFDDHDGIVDHQPDGCGQPAQRHQVETLAQEFERDEGHQNRDRNDQSGDDRCSPVAQEDHQDDGGQNQAQQNGIAHALDGIADDDGLVVERLDLNSRRQRLANLGDFVVYFIRDLAWCCCRAGG